MSEIKIKILGTVTPYCCNSHNCPGFLIFINDTKIMLDCGNGITNQLDFPNDLKKLNILISHLHLDHYGDVSSLVGAIKAQKKGGIYYGNINFFIPKINQDTIESKFLKHIISEIKRNSLTEYDETSINLIKDINISFLKASHNIPTFSTKIEKDGIKFIYSSDTGYSNAEKLIEFSYKSDLLICDSTFIKRLKKNTTTHLHAYQAAEIAKEAKVKKLLLTHFLPNISREEYLNEAKEIFENTEIANEGNILILKK